MYTYTTNIYIRERESMRCVRVSKTKRNKERASLSRTVYMERAQRRQTAVVRKSFEEMELHRCKLQRCEKKEQSE